jgi:hypothetical protein
VNSPLVPSSLELISLIKEVNPTTLCLSDAEREHGYEMKSRLQNVLLEQYGEAFCLAPHPLNPNIVLIKHTSLPSIDACHANLTALSWQALDSVAAHEPALCAQKSPKKPHKAKREEAADGDSPPEVWKRAQRLLDEYDFAGAAELLCGIRISDPDEIVFAERAGRALVEEIGAYQQAIEMLSAQQNQFLRDPRLRVLLALAYYLSGALPEARAIFDDLHRGEFDKEALVAYADIASKDGNFLLALKLLKAAEETEGYAVSLESLKQEVESALHAKAEPLLVRALSALHGEDLPEAELLARQALQLCPSSHGAREILARINSEKQAAEVAVLWERLGQTERCQGRLELLEKLSGRDRENQERITALIAAEKMRQKRESAQECLERLRTLVKESAWPEAFDKVWWLQGQIDQAEACREACSISSCLSVLYENRRLKRLSERSARQLWLDFVQAMTSVHSGQPGGCLEVLERVKHYFETYQAFSEVYHLTLTYEQEKAREEIKGHLLTAALEETTLSQAQHCFSAVRRAMVHLPTEESAEYCRILEERIAELTPPQDDQLIEAYRHYLRSGSRERAALLRNSSSDQAVFDRINAELADEFAIERSPVHLQFSDTLEVDLLSGQPLNWIGSTDRHILLREADDAILIVHLEKMKATRFVSPNFKDLFPVDYIPQDDLFLFRDLQNPLPRWRAELSDEKSAFTACFDIRHFCEDEDDCPVCIHLSSERDTDYYAVIWDMKGVKPARVVRKKLWNKSPISDSIKIGNKTQTWMVRLSCHPDKFIIGAEDEMKVCAKNLTSDYRVDVDPKDIWAIDLAHGHFYYFDRALLKRTDLEFEHTEKYLNSGGCYFFHERHHILGLCPSTSTLQVSFSAKAALYNYTNNMLSHPFSWGRVIGAKPARNWYVYDYCKETRTLTFRDITGELSNLLTWEVAECAILKDKEDDQGSKEGDPDNFSKLYEQIYFGYQPEEKQEERPGGEEDD